MLCICFDFQFVFLEARFLSPRHPHTEGERQYHQQPHPHLAAASVDGQADGRAEKMSIVASPPRIVFLETMLCLIFTSALQINSFSWQHVS